MYNSFLEFYFFLKILLLSYFNKLIEILENEWKIEKKTHNWNYADYCKKYIEVVGLLNKELRNLQQDELNKFYIKFIDELLSLEESNYKYTIGIFAKKIRYYDLLKKDADEEEFEKNENDILEARSKKEQIRERINEVLQEIIYS